MEKDNPCTGQCCEKFWLAMGPEELKDRYIIAMEYAGAERYDIEKIAPMVIYLGPDEEKGHWYTCKWYDKESTMCTIYPIRPRMCKDFPYDNKCQYCGWENEDFVRDVRPAGGISIEEFPT